MFMETNALTLGISFDYVEISRASATWSYDNPDFLLNNYRERVYSHKFSLQNCLIPVSYLLSSGS